MKVTTSFCRGCIYQGYAGGYQRCCDYIFKVGKPRPCPPGKDCTVRTTVRQRPKAEKPKVRGTVKACEWCGTEFVLNNNGSQKYCCKRCRDAAFRDRYKKSMEGMIK
jgi:hypothetical protein